MLALGSLPALTYVMEHGRSVAEVRLDTLTHGVTERSVDTYSHAVLPREAGVYELPWEAHAGKPEEASSGTYHDRGWGRSRKPVRR